MKKPRRTWRLLALALLGAAGLAAAAAAGVDSWLDYSEEPESADMIVVLGGGFSRPFYAADLYRRGLSKEIWLCRPRPDPALKLVRELGVRVPLEEEINVEILRRRGVPASSIRLYGADVRSTADEARVFGREADARGRRLLVVTSRPHARRAALIFRAALPEAGKITVAASPYEPFVRPWWKDQDMARWAVLELAKTAYYIGGGRFFSR
jgi:uncharacterized SAM-binding protein YcdF (DUF218 family)